MNSNPLKAPIINILNQHPDGLSEYDLIKALEELDLVHRSSDLGAELALFQTHFVVMNALYQIDQQLMGAQLLTISPLKIKLYPAADTCSENSVSINTCSENSFSINKELNSEPPAPQEVKDYYLDWNNYNEADEASVNELLNQFWQRYLVSDQRMWAYEVFDIETESLWPDVQKRYRQLSQQHHPDKGGKHEQFVEICQAYEVLSKTYGKA